MNPRVIVFSLLVSAALFFISFSLHSEGPPYKKVLVVHSYDPDYAWVKEINRGIEKVFHGKPVELAMTYMDTKRKTADEWKAKEARNAREKIEAWKPDLVIVADDNAQLFVTRQYLNKKLPIIFCGVSADPAEYGFPSSNVTGVVEWPFLKETIQYLENLITAKKPIRKIALLSDTCSTSIEGMMIMRRQPLDQKVLGYHLINDIETWKERVLEYNGSADALVIHTYHTLMDKTETVSIDPKTVMNWTASNVKIPTAGLYDFTIEDGLFCGYAVSGEEQGTMAAEMAWDVLNGKPITEIPVKKPVKGLKIINLKAAEKLGLKISEKDLAEADRIIR